MMGMEKKKKNSIRTKKVEKAEPIWKKPVIGGSMFGNNNINNYSQKMKVKPNKIFRGVK